MIQIPYRRYTSQRCRGVPIECQWGQTTADQLRRWHRRCSRSAVGRSPSMPDKATIARARRAKRQGKAPTTQAGEFVREEIHHVREGKHGARSTKQAIAIGLSKARRAGVHLRTPKNAKASTKRSAKSATSAAKRHARPSRRRAN